MVLTQEEKDIITDLFFKGFTHREIHYILVKQHGIQISFTYLSKKVLPRMGLCRRGPLSISPFNDIINTVQFELASGPARCGGAEEMRQILKTKYHLKVPRYMVREILRVLAPEDVARRQSRRLMRRQYRSRGPNFVWHIDGYDKLSPYGLCIHGAIDGFSRFIIWMKVACSNHDPKYIAGYFMEAVHNCEGCPTIIRSDCGTETVNTATIQSLLRDSHGDSLSQNSVWYGSSHSNQRIESWWCQLRKKRSDWWRTHFRDMEANGEIQLGNLVHRMCIQYAYMSLMQRELDEVVYRWNSHRIRTQRNGDVVSGVPEILYYHPEIQGCHDYLRDVDLNSNEVLLCTNDLCTFGDGQDDDFKQVAEEICQLNGINPNPQDASEARLLYLALRREMEQMI